MMLTVMVDTFRSLAEREKLNKASEIRRLAEQEAQQKRKEREEAEKRFSKKEAWIRGRIRRVYTIEEATEYVHKIRDKMDKSERNALEKKLAEDLGPEFVAAQKKKDEERKKG